MDAETKHKLGDLQYAAHVMQEMETATDPRDMEPERYMAFAQLVCELMRTSLNVHIALTVFKKHPILANELENMRITNIIEFDRKHYCPELHELMNKLTRRPA